MQLLIYFEIPSPVPARSRLRFGAFLNGVRPAKSHQKTEPCGAANPGCSRLSGGFFYDARGSRHGPSREADKSALSGPEFPFWPRKLLINWLRTGTTVPVSRAARVCLPDPRFAR